MKHNRNIAASIILTSVMTLCSCGSKSAASQETTASGTQPTIHVEVYPVYTSQMFAEIAPDFITDSNRTVIDSITTGIDRYITYSPADTAEINRVLANMPDYVSHAWVDWPTGSQSLELVIYSLEPLLSEIVDVHMETDTAMYGDNALLSFRFPDSKTWETITSDAVGRQLALSINGIIASAPKVNCAIESGNCSVMVPCDRINSYITDNRP